MTAATSNNKPASPAKNNVFRRRFFNDISDSRRTAIVHCILCMMGLPLMTSMIILMQHAAQNDNETAMLQETLIGVPFLLISFGMLCLALPLGIVVALFNFSYLYRKTITDMHYSLPINGNQRFFADYFSGLAVYTIPFIISDIIGGIILRAGFLFVFIEDVGAIMTVYLQASLICVITMVLYYSLCVLAIVFCGSTFEAIFSSIMVLFVIPSAVLCYWLDILSSASYGMSFSSVLSEPLLTTTNPFGALIYFINYMGNAVPSDVTSSYTISSLVRWSIITLIVSVAFTALAFLLYKLRKAEDVSKPYVFKAYFYIMLTLGVFCIVSLFHSGFDIIVPAVVISGVMWFIMEVITRRGFKRFWTAAVSFAVSVTLVIGVVQICSLTNGFGIADKVPSASSVESVKIELEMIRYVGDYSNKAAFRDRDVIEAAVSAHKDILDLYKKYETMEEENSFNKMYAINDEQSLDITYKTYTGKEISRSYTVSSEVLSDLIGSIVLSDEYADMMCETFDYFERENGLKFMIYDEFETDFTTGYLSFEQGEELRRAYKEDLNAMTKEDLPKMGNVKYILENRIEVPECFENTLAVLEKYVEELPETNFARSPEVQVYPAIKSYFYGKNFSGDYRTLKVYYDTMTDLGVNYISVGNDVINYGIDVSKPGADEFLDRFVSNMYKEKPIAVLRCDRNMLFLLDSEENRELLAKYLIVLSDDDYYY